MNYHRLILTLIISITTLLANGGTIIQKSTTQLIGQQNPEEQFLVDNHDKISIQNTTLNPLTVKIEYFCGKMPGAILTIPPMASKNSEKFTTSNCYTIPNVYLIGINGNKIGTITGASIQKYPYNSWIDALEFNQSNTAYMYNLILGAKTRLFQSHHSYIIVQIYDGEKSAPINTENWLKLIPDDTNINQIVMPGSHDAGMDRAHHKTIGVLDNNVITQRADIYYQLMSGSRYFDIRPDIDYGDLVTYHRSADALGANGINILGSGNDTVFAQASKFLEKNPSEFVILKFSHVRNYACGFPFGHCPDQIIDRLLKEIYNNKIYADKIYTADSQNGLNKNLKLKDLRGRMLLVFDATDGPTGQFYHNLDFECPDGSKTSIYSPCSGFFTYFDQAISGYSFGLNVYDVYSSTPTYNIMANDQLEKLNKYGGMGNNYLFLLSWTLTGQIFKNLNIRELATPAIANIPEALYELYHKTPDLQANYSKMPNIVYMDFINPYTDMSVIYYNYLIFNPNWITEADTRSIPGGSYKNSCSNINYVNGQLSAICNDGIKKRYLHVNARINSNCKNNGKHLSCAIE